MINKPHKIVAVDPAGINSAFLVADSAYNLSVESFLGSNCSAGVLLGSSRPDLLVIEEIKSYGMPFGQSLIDTCYFIGRLLQRCEDLSIPVVLLSRKTVVNTLLGGVNGNDSMIRAYLINRYGKDKTKGIVKDLWSALAIYTAYLDLLALGKAPAPIPSVLSATGEGMRTPAPCEFLED